MGQVAISAGYYLMAKLEMRPFSVRSVAERHAMNTTSMDRGMLKPLMLPRWDKVLAVRGNELLELGSDGRIIHRQDGFNSLSEAVGLDGGHRLVTDFMGRAVIEYDQDWKELKRHQVPFQPRGSHLLQDGRMLVVGMSQLQLFNAAGAAVGETIRFARSNFTGSRRIGKKRLLVTCNDSGSIFEMDFSGETLSVLAAENHPRSVQILDDGRLLVADFRQAVIYSAEGKAEWRHALEGVRSAHRLPSGNILLGHPSGLSVIDPSGDVLWEMKHPSRRGSGFFCQLE